ncbi:hypothetical protein KTD31_03700 [Burkholderia multivorans]|uniref:hypothetical protein n=1 Tax=Burkholderia multivorans TaxID=87883 RepID=UPI001C21DCBF|nr:hypothetical protein [Burkholderia multivorans]MBU9200459.1 hypothetical protein [Burkholderia multivorans]MDN8078416.1 hypothetical protein [Burkholderia multivorans]
MRNIFICLTAGLMLGAASLPAMAAPSSTPPDASPPALKDFYDLNVTMQSRVCGELMTNMALVGVQALEAQADGGIVPKDKRQPVYETAAEALVLLSMAGGLPVEDRLRAGGVTVAIGKLSSQAQVDTTRFCQRRVAAWIKAKQVKRDYIDKAYEQAKIMMDRAFDTVEQNQLSESNQDRPIAESVAK